MKRIFDKLVKVVACFTMSLGLVCANPKSVVNGYYHKDVSCEDLHSAMDYALRELDREGFTYNSAGSCTGVLARVLMYVDMQYGTGLSDDGGVQYFVPNVNNERWNDMSLQNPTKYSGSMVAIGLENNDFEEIGSGFDSQNDLNNSDVQSGDIFSMEDVNGGRRSGASGHCGFITRVGNTVYLRSLSSGFGAEPLTLDSYYGSKGGRIHVYRIGTTSKDINIKINKINADENLTNGNNQYSLNGAEYGVYYDSNCTQYITTLTTNSNGYAETTLSNMNANVSELFVKETKASMGFCLDKDVHRVAVNGTSGTIYTDTVNSYEHAGNDPLTITINKVSEDGEYVSDNVPSLEGAEFTVKYYNAQYCSVDSLPITPTKTWVIKNY